MEPIVFWILVYFILLLTGVFCLMFFLAKHPEKCKFGEGNDWRKLDCELAEDLYNFIDNNGHKELLIKFVNKYSHKGYSEKEMSLLKNLLVSKGIKCDNKTLRSTVSMVEKNLKFVNFFNSFRSINNNLNDHLVHFSDRYPQNEENLMMLYKLLDSKNIKYSKRDIQPTLSNIKYKKRLRTFENQLNDSGQSIDLWDVDNMTGLEFERCVLKIYSGMGYDVELTPHTGDQGADLIAKKNDEISVLQVKRHSSKIGNRAVQEVIAAHSYYNAERALVVTNNFFTKSAIELAKASNVTLIDRERLNKLIEDYH